MIRFSPVPYWRLLLESMVVPVSLKSFYQYITRPGRLSLPHPKSGLSRVLAPTQPQVDAFSSGTSFEASGRWTRDKRRLHELRSHPKLPECRFAEAFLQWQCCEIQIYAHLSYQHYHSYSLFIIHLLWMQPWRFWESYRRIAFPGEGWHCRVASWIARKTSTASSWQMLP